MFEHFDRIRPPARRAAGLAFSSALAVAGLATTAPASAQTTTTELVPFASFVNGLSSARAADFIASPGAAVQTEAAFEEIRDHLLKSMVGRRYSAALYRTAKHLTAYRLLSNQRNACWV